MPAQKKIRFIRRTKAKTRKRLGDLFLGTVVNHVLIARSGCRAVHSPEVLVHLARMSPPSTGNMTALQQLVNVTLTLNPKP